MTSDVSEVLAPCPFCGSQPKVLPTRPDLDGDAWARVICVNSYCHVQPAVEAYVDKNPKAAAIAKWNTRAQPAVLAVPGELRKIGQLIRTQDNRATDAPIFIVQQKRSYVTEDDYNQCRYEWAETESGEYCGPVDADELQMLEKFYSDEGHEPKGWKRFAMMDVWEFVTACFTEQGCKDFIAINGHNLKEPRIYAEGSYRNAEWRTIRDILIAAPLYMKGGEHA